MAREILTAANSGFCFGVKQAIEKTEEEIRRKAESSSPGRIYTWGPLIHNKTVTDGLREKGVSILDSLESVRPEDVIIVRSHGETKEFFENARARNCKIIDATCPFVKKIQQIRKFAVLFLLNLFHQSHCFFSYYFLFVCCYYIHLYS